MTEILAAAERDAVEMYLDEHVAPVFGCPNPDCGETLFDNLAWCNIDPDEADFDASRPEYVRCTTCGTEYIL